MFVIDSLLLQDTPPFGSTWLCKEVEYLKWTVSSTTPVLAAAAIAEDFIPADSAPHQAGIHNIITPSNYNRLGKLFAIIAYVIRFINNLKSLTKANLISLSSTKSLYITSAITQTF